METLDARDDLPVIAGISGCPLIDSDGRIIGKGYDPQSGWFIASGETPLDVPLDEAAEAVERRTFVVRRAAERCLWCWLKLLSP